MPFIGKKRTKIKGKGNMKKITLLFITAVMVLSLCACDRKGNRATSTDITEKQIQQIIEELEREEQERQEKQGTN